MDVSKLKLFDQSKLHKIIIFKKSENNLIFVPDSQLLNDINKLVELSTQSVSVSYLKS